MKSTTLKAFYDTLLWNGKEYFRYHIAFAAVSRPETGVWQISGGNES